jgi:ethanolamine ammonia-lyase small subunit
MTKSEAKPAFAAVNELFSKSPDGLREIVRAVMQEMLEAEMTDALGQATFANCAMCCLVSSCRPKIASLTVRPSPRLQVLNSTGSAAGRSKVGIARKCCRHTPRQATTSARPPGGLVFHATRSTALWTIDRPSSERNTEQRG